MAKVGQPEGGEAITARSSDGTGRAEQPPPLAEERPLTKPDSTDPGGEGQGRPGAGGRGKGAAAVGTRRPDFRPGHTARCSPSGAGGRPPSGTGAQTRPAQRRGLHWGSGSSSQGLLWKGALRPVPTASSRLSGARRPHGGCRQALSHEGEKGFQSFQSGEPCRTPKDYGDPCKEE